MHRKRFSQLLPSDIDLLVFDLRIVLPVTPDVSNPSSKFERCMVFCCRVNSCHGTDGRTDGQTGGV